MTLTDFTALRARFQSRSLWKLWYIDGTSISEHQMDWALVPFHGRRMLRLYCPDGRIAELGSTDDATGRLFQFKIAEVRGDGVRSTVAHVIGLVDEPDGNCQFAAWEYTTRQLVTGRDNAHFFTYQNAGRLSHAVLGLKL